MGHREVSGSRETEKTMAHDAAGGGEVAGAEATMRAGEESGTMTMEMETSLRVSPPALWS